MELILLEKIRNLGALGDKVKVKPGYGRNFLVPKGKAVFATKLNLEKFEERRAQLEKAAAIALAEAEVRRDALQALDIITLTAKAGDEGKLFGSIGARDIAEAITKAGIEVAKNDVLLPNALRQLGDYEIQVELYADVIALVKLSIVSDRPSNN